MIKYLIVIWIVSWCIPDCVMSDYYTSVNNITSAQQKLIQHTNLMWRVQIVFRSLSISLVSRYYIFVIQLKLDAIA